MKHLRETFTDEEFTKIKKAKNISELNWHDFILSLNVCPACESAFDERLKKR